MGMVMRRTEHLGQCEGKSVPQVQWKECVERVENKEVHGQETGEP